jgi:hypothetical protein
MSSFEAVDSLLTHVGRPECVRSAQAARDFNDASRRLLSHWQHKGVDDDALDLLEESNMIQLRLSSEQARVAFCFLQVPPYNSHDCAEHYALPTVALQRRALQQQVNTLSQELRRVEHELDEAQERGDSAMLQVASDNFVRAFHLRARSSSSCALFIFVRALHV